MRPFPGILSGVLAAATVIAAFGCAVWLAAPRRAERARWPERVSTDSRQSLQLLAPAPALLPVVRPVVAPVPGVTRTRTLSVPATPRPATPTARVAPVVAVQAPSATSPAGPDRSVAPRSVPKAAETPKTPAAPAGTQLEPAAALVDGASSSAGQAVTPVSPQAGSAVAQAGATVAAVIRGS